MKSTICSTIEIHETEVKANYAFSYRVPDNVDLPVIHHTCYYQ